MSSANGWPMVRLGEVAKFIRGVTFKPADKVNSEDGVPVMRTKNVQASLEFSDVIRIPASLVKEDRYLRVGDTLVSTANSWNLVGKCCWVPELTEPTAIGGFVSALRATSEQLLPRYLYYWFNSYKIQATVRSFSNQTTNIANLAIKRCLDLKIPLPPLPEQQRIADILDTSAEVIHKEEYLQRSILPLAVNAVERKVASSDSRLGNLIESMSSGKNVAESSDPKQKNRVLKVSAVTSGTFKPAESKPLPDTYLPPKAHQVRKGDILVSRANTTELLGASALVENDVESLYLPDKIWRVTPKDGVDPDLLWGILQTKTVRARISQRATGSSGSMKNISQKNFLQVPCATFSRSESVKLAALIREAVSVHHQIAQKLTLLRSLHHSLSTRAFAGQL